MKNYIIRRLLQMIPVFLGILLILFFIVENSPGSFVNNLIDPNMTAEMKAQLAEKLGINQPFLVKFWTWLTQLFQGSLGSSFKYYIPVTDLLKQYMGPTFLLSFSSLIIALLIGIPLGIVSATKQYTLVDNLLTVFALIGISLPSFFFALLLLKFFAVDIPIFPLFGMRNPLLMTNNWFAKAGDVAYHMVLPVMMLGLSSSASFMRYTRTSMLEVIRQDYIRTARAKGLKEKVIIYKHAFRNALIPIITLLGFWIPSLLSGAVMTETIFALPGLGKISVDATMTRDYPVILGVNTMLAMLTLIAALVADILYAFADPRIKYD